MSRGPNYYIKEIDLIINYLQDSGYPFWEEKEDFVSYYNSNVPKDRARQWSALHSKINSMSKGKYKSIIDEAKWTSQGDISAPVFAGGNSSSANFLDAMIPDEEISEIEPQETNPFSIEVFHFYLVLCLKYLLLQILVGLQQ